MSGRRSAEVVRIMAGIWRKWKLWGLQMDGKRNPVIMRSPNRLNMNHFLLNAAIFLACAVIAPALAEGKRPRPNFLFIFADDQPQNLMGCMGNKQIKTPHMDQLAEEGVLFTNAFVTTAICCSNRASILTGQHMLRHGIRDFEQPLSAGAFSQTYPAILREAGYRTGYLGKYAIGGGRKPGVEELALPKHEFDFWYGFPQSIAYRQEIDGEARYLTTEMEKKAVEFLRSQPEDQPFCLTVALKEPHGPLGFYDPEIGDPYENATISLPTTFTREHFEKQPGFIRKSLNADFAQAWLDDPRNATDSVRKIYRMVSRADLALGRILKALDDAKLAKNTVVIYSSDHGLLLGDHGLSGKWLMYEDSIRVPLIIRDPGLPAARRGARCEEMALSIDLAPTMLAMAGLPIPRAMQGRDLTTLLEGGKADWRKDWYYEHSYVPKPTRPQIAKSEGVRETQWKYIRYFGQTPAYEQLFDLSKDPDEVENLAEQAEHADVLDRLRKRCDEYRRNLP